MTPPRALPLLLLLAACGTAPIGRPPAFTPADYPIPDEEAAMRDPLALPAAMTALPASGAAGSASLWTGARGSLLGDNRAVSRGDILTVVIEIDDSAQINNSTDRGRSNSESLGVDALFGLPESVNGDLPGGAGLSPAVDLTSQNSFSGQGTVKRAEQLELRIAATVTEVLPNGVLAIGGSQEVRVNNELRELLVTGFVRPTDITRQNEVTYDKIAQARISYGGRGQITDVQQPRVGTQVLDRVLPF
ncbi:flagellar basal body L-ring protein FlgH [Rubellimicrobium aerolatum]|uniref:Flagellar L-ring protein n=1 Tax=Rubellimicrobium aerolatum TaxID=490979 RepID=A0ABW0S9V9_9RHOB|nr:flagellar basal body L-ring protein FlgH [Rubellimicrobium aerolatum]MBP1805072.1 flagellar L-ring protein precursor FlgH [Rubellimicrobium aerolatum]